MAILLRHTTGAIMLTKLIVIISLFLGAFSGWWFSAAFWIAARPPKRAFWSGGHLEYLLTAYICVLLSALCGAGRDKSLRRRLIIGVTIGSALGWTLTPPTTARFEIRVRLLFVHPGIFTPTGLVVGAFVGGVVALFLPEFWRFVRWIRNWLPRSRSKESQK